MVELYWPRNTTFSVSTPSGLDQYDPGLHDIDEDRAEAFKNRGWVDPSDDDVDVEIDRGDATVTVEDDSDRGQEEEVELDEDELSLTSDGPDLEDDTDDTTAADREAAAEGDSEDDDFDAQSFVDRTPQKRVIADLESGDYDEHLDDIAEAEERGRGRRGVASAVNDRRDAS